MIRGQITALGKFPYSFREACEFFKDPNMELVKVERLGQELNVPTQGQRVAQTGTRPFSLMMPGCEIPIQESNPGHIGERPTD